MEMHVARDCVVVVTCFDGIGWERRGVVSDRLDPRRGGAIFVIGCIGV